MDWAILALLSAAVFGVVSIIDKHLVDRIVQNFRALLFILGIMGILLCIPFIIAEPSYSGYSAKALAAALGSGLTRGIAMSLTFWVLRREEVSRALPVTMTYPIFVAILAALFLDEDIGIREWASIFVIVAGAILLSARRAPGALGGFLLGSSFFLLMLSSFNGGLSNFLGKIALDEISIVQVFTINLFFIGVTVLVMSTSRTAIRGAWEIVRERPRHLPWFVADMLVALLGTYLLFSAFDVGPVSGAAALNATRPMFIFLYVVALSLLAPRFMYESLTGRALSIKFAAIVMIVAGTARLVAG